MTDADPSAPVESEIGEEDLTLRDRIARTGRRLTRRIDALRSETSGLRGDVVALQGEVDTLRRDLRQLQHEVHLDRRMHRRVAELTDVMQELLLPASQRDEDRLEELLDRYRGE
jgi:predicted RNase H-like nuclease (RuvC/YqgF family)